MIKTINQMHQQNMNNGDDDDEEYDVLAEVHDGIINGDLNMIHQALDAGANPNEKFTEDIDAQHGDMTPLALAAALNKAPAVKMLLDYKANVNDTFASLHTTALMTASFHGHADIVRMLLKRQADVNMVDLQGSTALGYAFGGTKSMDVISQLLKGGIDVNSKNMLGMNGLLLVAGYSNDSLVRMVIDAGADANSTNDFLHTALHIVVVGKWSQIRAITQGQLGNYGLNRKNIGQLLKDWTRAHRDLVKNQFDDQKLDKVGQFMTDIGKKYREADGDLEDEDDQEAMKRRVEAVWHYRESRGTTDANKKSNSKSTGKKPGVMDNLLACGGRRSKQAKKLGEDAPGARPGEGEARPYSAEMQRGIDDVSDKCARILRMIIDAGCAVEKVEKTFGMTALDMAIVFGDLESTAILMSAGGDPFHLLKMFTLSDLHDGIINLDKKKVKETLSDPDIDVNGEFSPFHTNTRLDDPQLASLQASGRTPIALSAQLSDVGALEIIKMLIRQGADINKCGANGSTAMGEAARLGNVKMCEFLVSQGGSVETPSASYKGATPVSIAAANKKPEVVQFLIDKEAKVDKKDENGRTSLIHAADNYDKNLIEMLLNANLLSNFSDRSGFMYDLAKQYQRPDKDFNTIMKSINEESQRLRSPEQQQPRLTNLQQSGRLPTTINNNNRFNNDPFTRTVPPPGADSSEEEEDLSPPRTGAYHKSNINQPKQQPQQGRKAPLKKPDSDSEETEEEEEVIQPKSQKQTPKQAPVLMKPSGKKVEVSESEEESDEEPTSQARPKAVQQNQAKPQPSKQPTKFVPKQKPKSESEEESSEESEDDLPLPPRPQVQQKTNNPVITKPSQPQLVQQKPNTSRTMLKKESSEEESSEEESEEESPPRPAQAQRSMAPAPNVRVAPAQVNKTTLQKPVVSQQQPEESSEEESDDDEPPPPAQRKPVLPSQKIETQFNKMSVNAAPRTAAQSRPNMVPPPLPASGPPEDEDESEEETDDSEEEEPPRMPVKVQPNTKIPVVVKGKVGPPTAAKTTTTTTTTRMIQPGGQTQNVTKTHVTKTIVTSNQGRMVAPAVLESDEDDDDDDDDDSEDGQHETDI